MEWFNSIDWAYWGAALGIVVIALVGVILTLLTLPGTWLIVLAAIGLKAWRPELIDWWTVGVLAGIAVLAEIVEFGAGALGAAKGGATKRGAIGAIVGSFVGAIAGTFIPLFPISTIAGGVVGAAAGTVLMERGSAQRSWADAARSGRGAAVGRLFATLSKTALAAVMGIVVSVAAFWN